MMRNEVRRAPSTLDDYLALPYPLEIVQGEYGSYVVRYPDLPGCVTQVKRLDDAIPMAREILEGWLELALEDGLDIPLPRQPSSFSGKFIVRIARSLHRELAESADRDGVSLNAYVSTLLAAGQVWHKTDQRFDEVCAKIEALHDRLPVSFDGVPQPKIADVDTRFALPDGYDVPLGLAA